MQTKERKAIHRRLDRPSFHAILSEGWWDGGG